MSADEESNLNAIARQLIWWQPAEESLAKPVRFLAQVMTLGTWKEVQEVKKVYGWDAFREALQNAPAGVFDGQSWVFWRNFFGLPEAEMPQRSLT